MFFNVEKNLNYFKSKLNNNFDVSSRTIMVGETKLGLLFIKSLMDKEVFVNSIMSPLLEFEGKNLNFEILENDVLKIFELEKIETDKDVITKLTQNNLIIFIDGKKGAIATDMEKAPVRTPAEPPTSSVIMGPREGFVEDIKSNIALIRMRLKTDKLVIKDFEVGRYTKTKVCIVSIDVISDTALVKKVEKKLESIDIDGVVDSHYILSFLQEGKGLLFKQVGTTEKPDIVVAKMLEGRIAILVDGSPIVLTLPFVFFEDLQSSNDYYTNPLYVTFMRIIRMLGVFLAAILPGVFLSFRLYHYKALPLKYLITVANSTQGLPFSPFVEMVFILVLFQILYEVSLRLPRYLGIATSIVGALVLGDTGVKAGLISSPVVIIIAMSIIAVYTVPEQAPQLTVLRVIFIFLGGTLGILGIVAGMIYFVNEMNTLNFYDVPYLAPYAPRISSDLKDALFKASVTQMEKRPVITKTKNKVRLKK